MTVASRRVSFYRDYGDPKVERLARAICRARQVDPDELVPDNGYGDAPLVPKWWKSQDAALDFLACYAAVQEEHDLRASAQDERQTRPTTPNIDRNETPKTSTF